MDSLQVLVLDFNEYVSSSSQAQIRFIEGIGQSLKQSGFVVCKNVGLDEVMSQVRQQERLFFETLSLEQKLRLFRPETKGERGFVPIGGETAIGEGYPDLKEYFEFGREGDERYDQNVWPAVELLPEFKSTMLRAYALQEKKAHILSRAVAQYLGLDVEALENDTVGGNSVMRLNFYPTKEYVIEMLHDYIENPTKALLSGQMAQEMLESLRDPLAAPKSIRAGKHKDSNYKTSLYNPDKGLQVSPCDDDCWIDIPVIQGAVVINIGKKLELKTGLPATVHRVVNPTLDFSKSRYTEPFFEHPHADCVLDGNTGLTDRDYMTDLLAQRYTAKK